MGQGWWWLLWAGLLGYGVFLAPADDPQGTWELLRRLMEGDIAGINPAVVAEFYLMGVLPLIYWCFLLPDGKTQNIRAWPFALAMMGVGVFALLPYMALRQPQQRFSGSLAGWERWGQSPWLGRLLTLGTMGLLVWGVRHGDWRDFWDLWLHNRFIHVMTLDFGLLCCLLPYWVGEDLVWRGLAVEDRIWGFRWIPLLGALAYLSGRPPLKAA
ncbi:MAG: hypothetical protein Q6J68_07140 [Thermostichales cyanobacterium SZTDM-1c_bins_54]